MILLLLRVRISSMGKAEKRFRTLINSPSNGFTLQERCGETRGRKKLGVVPDLAGKEIQTF